MRWRGEINQRQRMTILHSEAGCEAWPPAPGARQMWTSAPPEVRQFRTKRKRKPDPSDPECFVHRPPQRKIGRYIAVWAKPGLSVSAVGGDKSPYHQQNPNSLVE